MPSGRSGPREEGPSVSIVNTQRRFRRWTVLGSVLLVLVVCLQIRAVWPQEDSAPALDPPRSPAAPVQSSSKIFRAATPDPTGSPGIPPIAANASPASPSSGSAPLPCDLEVERTGRIVLSHCEEGEVLPRGESGARRFLRAHAETLGLSEDLAALETVEVQHGLAGTRTLFDQKLAGLPVHDARISVNQNADGTVTGVFSTYHASLKEPSALPSLSATQAEEVAQNAAGTTSLRMPSQVEPVWFLTSGSELRLAWRLMVYSAEPLGDFLTLVDDSSAKVLLQENRIAFDTGSGLVYQPNPIQSSGNMGLADSNDSTSNVLDAERVNVPLLGLDSGVGTLRGEYVDLVSLPGGLDVPDADEITRVYQYDRSDDRFEQVVIYSTIDAIQRYFHSLGFDSDVGIDNGIRDFPTLANAHWNTDDQSFYSSGNDAIHFGDGGVDDGEDADIIAHEFGHAVQHDQNACWGGGAMGAMGEGFGDYLAASFFADAGDATFQGSHAACVGEWDASSFSSSTPPCLRRVDGNKQYPDDYVGNPNTLHSDGEIWSRALWDLRQALTATVADQLVFEHHFLVPCQASMPDAANQILQADINLNGGANDAAIRIAFCDRGILSGDACTPPTALSLTQTLSPASPVAGQAVTLTLTATNSSASTFSAVVFTANVPTGSSYVASSASDSGTESGGTVTWPATDLGAAQQIQRSFSVLLAGGLGEATLFEDDMDSGGSLWAVSHAVGSVDWSLSTAQPRSVANSWFGPDPSLRSDQFVMPITPVAVQSGTTTSLVFWHRYDTETGFDGGVAEASIDGGANWTDLGGAMTLNGYSGLIGAGTGSPISGRSAFTGNSGGYIKTEIDLQSLAGNDVLFRFRMTSDSTIGGHGWHIDDVLIAQVDHFASTFTAAGGASASSTSTVNVQPPPPNTPPQLTVNTGLSLDQGAAGVIGSNQLQATDTDAGDILIYTVSAPPSNGTLTPSSGFTQAQIDAGSVSYQHDGSGVLSDGFDFSVSDGQGGAVPTTAFALTITSVNQGPSLGLSILSDATAGVAYLLTLSPSDPNSSDTLSVFLDSGPAWLGDPVDAGSNTWTLSGAPGASDVGMNSITLRVRDSGSPALEDQATLNLSVQAPPVQVPGLSRLARLVMSLLAVAVGLGTIRRRL
jgi:uncharacterized repeat protein (TIGR01451 family)